jgi:nucleoid-associated protein YgaU
MTRETKIGLVVGLAFIILLGVIISENGGDRARAGRAWLDPDGNIDHLQADKSFNQNEGFASGGMPDIEISTLGKNTFEGAGKGRLALAAEKGYDAIKLPSPEEEPPTLAVSRSDGSDFSATPERPLDSDSVPPIPVAGDDQDTPEETVVLPDASAVKAATDEIRRVEALNEAARKSPISYTVKKGDNLEKIARRHYGPASARRWRAIYNANKNVIADPHRLPIGAKLSIPQGGLMKSGDVSKQASGALRIGDQDGADGSKTRWYTVRRYDTLVSISIKQLKNANRYNQIFELNRDKIKNPNLLMPGMRIRLPAK